LLIASCSGVRRGEREIKRQALDTSAFT